ncbi:MAG: hypothetical protein KGI40_02135 [Xanthomonadaceae bacterium]|nr:hypothetical protein [Xanthomonadaceae bacterium]MDE1957876.1 hypothetical protein [Xanthomonadaceae bacterium]MDE2177067.1 hypothetical protein [Xanthomonadaceae bacterium]MDE2246561.1 hypothetical protein [Xanthomonadaceae bacterium]
MQPAYARLIEGLPARNPAAAGAPARPREVQQRVAQLPLASPELAARELSRLLGEMRASLWSGADRLDALELLRAPAEQLSSAFERPLLAESFPLPPIKARMADMAREVHLRLGEGYALAVHELCAPAGKVPMLRGKAVTLALLRAQQHLGLALLWSYRLYRTPPPGVWIRLHAVYAFALEAGLATKAVNGNGHAGGHDVRGAYLHSLLLALCNPYRLTLREMGDAYALTQALASHCEITRGGESGFAMRADADSGPGYVPEEREQAQGDLLALDVEPVMQLLERNAALLPPGADKLNFRTDRGSLEVSRAFVERLRAAWIGAAARGHARIGAQHVLETVIGLHGLHYLLAGGQDFQAFLARVRGAGITLSSSENAAAWTSGGESLRAAVLSARVLDQSLGGYRLLWEPGAAVRLKVGELVGLALPAERGDVQDWMVGLIRWLRVDDEGRLDAGVELLARHALAVAVRTPDAQGQLRPPLRAVLLRLDDGESLLVPSLFDRAASAVELSRPADPRDWHPQAPVQLLLPAAIVETSAAYWRITLSPMQSVKAAPLASVAAG